MIVLQIILVYLFKNHIKNAISLKRKHHLKKKRNNKCTIIRETVSKISEDNISTAVDRLYGAKQSLQSWDADRKKLI